MFSRNEVVRYVALAGRGSKTGAKRGFHVALCHARDQILIVSGFERTDITPLLVIRVTPNDTDIKTSVSENENIVSRHLIEAELWW